VKSFARGAATQVGHWWDANEISGSNFGRAFWFLSPLALLIFLILLRFAINPSTDEKLFTRGDPASQIALLSSIAQVLASVFAIVFAVALLLMDVVERRYNNPSLVRIYLDHRTTVFFPAAFFWALVADLIALANGGGTTPAWAVEGTVAYALAALSFLYLFVRTTARFIDPSALLEILERDTASLWRTAK